MAGKVTFVKLPEPKKPRPYGFQPGVSGNPSGRPKRAKDLAIKAAAFDDEVLMMYVTIIRDSKASRKDKLTAGQALLDRGFGRPGQSVIVAGDAENPLVTGQLSPEQMAEVVAAARNLDDDV